MKYGLIKYGKTDNLGDDIQSFATRAFLPHVDYLIERERLHEFKTSNNCKAAVIFSGWYLYAHLNWPPSPYIYPLNISIHFDTYYSKYLGKTLEKNMVLEGYGAKWLNDHGSVGARDYSTLNLLSGFGINSYWSGCITLTLIKNNEIPKSDLIVAVDVSPDIIHKIKEVSHKRVLTKTHKIKLENFTMEQRYHIVEDHLKLYQSAALVVTSRLHAALPCLAYGTPVLFIKDTRFFNRTGTYVKYLNSAFEHDVLSKTFNYCFDNPPPNPTEHYEIQKSLNETCKNFIHQCELMEDIPVLPEMIENDIQLRYQHILAFHERVLNDKG